MANDVQVFAYTGSDTAVHLKAKTKNPDGTESYINWAAYDEITLIIREGISGQGAAMSAGVHVATLSTVTTPGLFKISGGLANDTLEVNLSQAPGLVNFSKYECLVKVHDLAHPNGQVIADYKRGNSASTLLLTAYPGDAS